MIAPGAALPLVWVVVGCFRLSSLGAFGALTPLIVQDAFGVKFYGSIMGIMSITMGVSSFLGPILGRMVVRRYGELSRRLSADCCAVLHRRDVAVPGEKSHAGGGANGEPSAVHKACQVGG